MFSDFMGKSIYFDEKEHRYWAKKIELTPVTTFIGSFFPKFEAERIAKLYAKKHGKTADHWLGQWEDKRDRASELGKRVHAYAYSRIKGTESPYRGKKKEIEYDYYRQVDIVIHSLRPRFDFLDAEKVVFSEALGLAGTIDLLLRDRSNGDIVIGDWKTNEEISAENVWGKALPPISPMDDCNLNKYSLQVNAYEAILIHEKFAERCRRFLIHLQPTKADLYKVPDMQADITNMLAWV